MHEPQPLAQDEDSGWTQTRVEAMRSNKRWFKFSLGLHSFYLVAALHVVIAISMLVSSYLKIEPLAVTINCIIALAVTDLIFYFILKSGYNLRLRDPGLIVPRSLVPIATLLYAQIYVGPTKGCTALAILIVFVLAGVHASIRTMTRLNLITVLAYAATIPLIKQVEGPRYNAHAELVNWLSFASAMPAALLIGATISTLRRNLALSNIRLTELAATDELTGVYNRRYIMDMMQHEHDRFLRSGTAFCVCLLDLDHFKRVNDVHGHQVGDTVLKAFAKLANESKREGDMFSRWGGEEFLLFMPQGNLAAARACADRIRCGTEELRFDEVAKGLRVSVSIGVAEYSPGEPVASLVERADQALYRAKQNGRNRVESAPPVLLMQAQSA